MMKQQNTRSKIIKSGLKVFTRKGYFKTTVDDIAKEVGIAKGTVYLYFKDKPSLYISTIEEHFAGAISFLEEIKVEEVSSTYKLRKIADAWYDYMLKYKSSFAMFTMENLNLSRKIMKALKPLIPKHIAKMTGVVAEIIDEGIKQKEFRQVEPRIAALHFLSTIRTAFFASYFFPELSGEIDTVLEVFFKGLAERG
jgi:TetR/AcrR family fatty acid metabolism transcriptional regulator